MTYGRYESRRNWREPRGRDEYRDDRSSRDEDRGFFERAGDEIASWFGDDDSQRRRERDERYDDDYRRPQQPYGSADYGVRSEWGRDTSRGEPTRSTGDYGRYERNPRFRDEGSRRPYTGRFASRGSGESGYRETGFDRGPSREDRYDRGWTQREFTGQASGLHDPHYSEWRRRQIDSLDRDYDEYRRENEGRFENEFGQWRENRASKRQMLGTVREHMTVVGSDGEHVGTVDKVKGDRICLTKSDSDDNHHHLINCSLVDSIDGDTVKLNVPSEEAKAKAHGESRRDRTLFERDNRDDDGPHMLNRSFSGTYES